MPTPKRSAPTRLLLDLYRTMLRIRRVEERLSALFADGTIPGFIHLSIGQESVPTAITHHLSNADTVAITHRGHGQALAKGISLDTFLAKMMGRASGICLGRGGSMHIADSSVGMHGANGIDDFLFLTDRLKDMTISGGENIASSEVERVVYQLECISEAAIIGVADPEWGERPEAFVVLHPGQQLTLEQLQSHCREHLAGFKIPKGLHLLDNLPRNASGKVLKRKLRDR